MKEIKDACFYQYSLFNRETCEEIDDTDLRVACKFVVFTPT